MLWTSFKNYNCDLTVQVTGMPVLDFVGKYTPVLSTICYIINQMRKTDGDKMKEKKKDC